jgi:hypothetical protein
VDKYVDVDSMYVPVAVAHRASHIYLYLAETETLGLRPCFLFLFVCLCDIVLYLQHADTEPPLALAPAHIAHLAEARFPV